MHNLVWNDPFAKLCYVFEGKKNFFCHHGFMKKGHSKLPEPENITEIKITWYICKGIKKSKNDLKESDSWTDKITLLIFV